MGPRTCLLPCSDRPALFPAPASTYSPAPASPRPFPPGPADVINQMQTDDMELKKLVYLYLINYAKTQPDLAIMAVNTFVKARREGCALRCLSFAPLLHLHEGICCDFACARLVLAG